VPLGKGAVGLPEADSIGEVPFLAKGPPAAGRRTWMRQEETSLVSVLWSPFDLCLAIT